MKKFNHQQNHQAGFTLVEMLVSIALFSVVATMSVGTLLVLMDANGRAQSMQLLMTNVSFAMDSISREIRTGTSWFCTDLNDPSNIPNGNQEQDCTSGTANFISVVESGSSVTGGESREERRISYLYSPNFHQGNKGAILRSLGTTGNAWTPVTGPDINITDFRIRVDGTNRSDTSQPRMTIFIKGEATALTEGVSTAPRTFSLQTTIVQRLLDV